ncbi:FAR-17a/AIG1-like protein [Boletus reticuloceps]|uniref:FAR-17a/AIG1-like protein n=1 Tax=Boletus reticuloceps TaxID=495285 RepID=A0A8I2YS88_9AGAM|nr:FAR-17a/AIG1-like protein [Boletus reticuloceps]
MEFIITSIYWPLLLFLPHLILPPTDVSPTAGLAPTLPLQVDLALHAIPLLTVLVDFFVFEPKFPRIYAHTAAPAAIVAFSVWYASFVEYCATLNGTFPYPFLTYSPFAVRVMIYTAVAGIGLGCFRTLNALHA